MVDENARQLVADGLLHDRRRNGGIDATGKATDHPLVANLLTNQGDLVVDDIGVRPGRFQPGDLVEEVLQNLLAILGVQHLGVELHASKPHTDRLESCDWGAG